MNITKLVAFVSAGSIIVLLSLRSPAPAIPTPSVAAISRPDTTVGPPSRGGVKAFMRLMSRVESDHTHTVVNKFGMMGKYQFHPNTVRALGFDVTQEEFLADPALQDRVMLAYMRSNRADLRKIIRQYDGKVVRGVRVTESGILAGAHLGGINGLLTFFYPNKYSGKTKDANGTTIKLYMEKFAGFNMQGL